MTDETGSAINDWIAKLTRKIASGKIVPMYYGQKLPPPSGIFMTTYQTQDQALLQLSAPRHIRGRVMSFYLTNRAAVPIGTLFAGALAHYFGGPPPPSV